MENRANIPLGEQFAATMDWWRDAGVDCVFTDEVAPLLREEEERPAAVRPTRKEAEVEAPPEPAIRAVDLPADLAGFRDWWVGPDNPFAFGSGVKIAPVGTKGAPLMVLVPMPEAEDRDTLLSGPQGRLTCNILRAIGIDPNLTYFASALPSHAALPDWDDLNRQGLGTVLSHHLRLAEPQRLLVFGSKLPALFGHDSSARVETFTSTGEIATLATFAPDRLLDHARQRARLWKRLCQWTA
ncbi:hypothetical protein [Aurantiacibacter poecillastricola]|uniref:hypothetical protein n=1 Tax=Aurantiacibacter poecillastricola TaxID=3064385 RepID=UPI00273DEABC|nr:hypothetical protein [Aurantiacibacter sp. 219JJ12-13]MDP5262179.1 hypothetical protein [Aurantiacibacter sp. 219JJ12-13]